MTGYERSDPRERSVSVNYESDLEGSQTGDGSAHGTPGASAPGKPGRKKNPNSQAARRDQNRIAQREFRLRKQQRIRDLEARVEILSGGKDEAASEMRNMLKDLMAENQNLRQMLRSLAGFIGDGMGGVLPKLGWDMNDFNNYVNKGETDTAWEGYQARKKLNSGDQSRSSAGPSSLPSLHSQKRPSEDAGLSGRQKKARNDDMDSRTANGFNMMPVAPGSGLFPSEADRGGGMFSDLMRGGPQQQQMFSQPQGPPPSNIAYGGMANPGMDNYSGAYLGVSLNHAPLVSSNFETSNGASSQSRLSGQQQVAPQDDEELDDDPNKSEAYKLLQYHLENYKRNPGYCLPSSLRPTKVQRSIPHQSVIDSVVHPELRDRMIVLRDKFPLVDCLIDFRRHTIIHGDDVLAHSNWEIGEAFFRKYPFLAEPATISIANRWRKERGEPEMRLADFDSPA